MSAQIMDRDKDGDTLGNKENLGKVQSVDPIR
jgi:hypothetical protein